MELERKTVSFEIKQFNEEEGVFEGHASTWEKDLGNDKINFGAFADTIVKRKDKNQVKLLPLHQWTFPIGKILELREDEKGLFIKAKLLMTEGELGGKNAKLLMSEGVLNEMSIGFTTDDTEINDEGTRIIKKIDLMEISLVLFGMNPNTEITSMKSVLENQVLKELQNEMQELKSMIEDKKPEELTEKEKLLAEFKKELNEKDSLNTMLENKLKERLNVDKGLYILEIFLDEVIFNYYSYGSTMPSNDFDKYMRQGYTVRGSEVELVGDMVEVELGRVFTDKKEESNKETQEKQQLLQDIKKILKVT